jgi:hypothetical protein
MNETFETKNIYLGAPEALTPLKFLNGVACKSKKLLFVVIAYMVSLASSFIGFFGIKVGFSSTVVQFIELFSQNLDAESAEALTNISAIASALDAAFLGIAVIVLLPAILTAVGALLIYLGAKKENPDMAYNGTLLLRILFTFHTVVCALGIAFTVIALLAATNDEPAIIVFAVIAGVILLVPLSIAASYYGKLTQMFRGLGKSVRTDINVLKVSSLVTVINWISAIIGIISAVTTIGSTSLLGISNLLSAIALIIVTTIFSDYKNEFGNPTKENIKAAKEYVKY